MPQWGGASSLLRQPALLFIRVNGGLNQRPPLSQGAAAKAKAGLQHQAEMVTSVARMELHSPTQLCDPGLSVSPSCTRAQRSHHLQQGSLTCSAPLSRTGAVSGLRGIGRSIPSAVRAQHHETHFLWVALPLMRSKTSSCFAKAQVVTAQGTADTVSLMADSRDVPPAAQCLSRRASPCRRAA